jgi:beta-N-acetylhexosaminidase
MWWKWRVLAWLRLAGPLLWASPARLKFSVPGPVRLDRAGESWAEKTLKHLTLEQKIGQMIVIWSRAQFFNQQSPQYLQLRDTIRKYHIGAVGPPSLWTPAFPAR